MPTASDGRHADGSDSFDGERRTVCACEEEMKGGQAAGGSNIMHVHTHIPQANGASQPSDGAVLH